MIGWIRRSMRAQLASVTLLGVLLAALCVLVAGGRAWLSTSGTAAFHQVLHHAPVAARTVTLRYTGRLGPAAVSAGYGHRLSHSLRAPLRDMVHRPWPAARSPALHADLLPSHDIRQRILTVASLPGARADVRWVAGQAPGSGTHRVRLPNRVAAAVGRDTATVLEVGVSRSSARALTVHPGSFTTGRQSIYLPDDPHNQVLLKVTGIYRPTAHVHGLEAVGGLRKPAIENDGTKVTASVLAADPATVLSVHWLGAPTAQWAFPGGGTIPAGQVQALAQQIGRLDAGGATGLAPGPGLHAEVITGLGQLAEDFLAAQGTSNALITLPATALLACALLALALAASVLARRRTHAGVLLTARGAGPGQLLVLRGGEGLLLALPAIAAGLGAATIVRIGAPTIGDVVAVVVAAVVGAGVVTVLGVLPAEGRGAGASRRGILRVAVQALVVVLAALGTGVLAIRQQVRAGDPFLTLVPVLIAGAATVLATQLLPRLLEHLRGLATRGTPLGPLLAVTQTLHAARTSVLPILVVVLTASTALLSLAVTATVPRGVNRAAWEQVGADVAVHSELFTMHSRRRAAALPGVEGVAAARVEYGVPVAHAGSASAVALVAVDPHALSRVRRGAPARLPLSSLNAPTSGGSVAAIASPGLSSADRPLVLDTDGGKVRIHVVGHARLVPGLTDPTTTFVLLTRSELARATGQLPAPDVLLISGHPHPAALHAALGGTAQDVRTTYRAEVAKGLRDQPMTIRTRTAFWVATGLAGMLAVAAVALSASSGGDRRRYTRAVLATLGAKARHTAWPAPARLVPVVLLAPVLGGLVGWGLCTLLGPTVNLGTFIGNPTQVHLDPDPHQVILAAVAVLVLATVVLLATALGATRRPAPATRTMETPEEPS